MIRALQGEVLDRPPFWLMRQAGRYLPEYREVRKNSKNFLEFCYSPELAVRVTLQPLERYHMDAAILFSDILVIPDALGQRVEFLEGEGPVLEPIRSTDDIKKLSPDRISDHLAPVFETLQRLAVEIPEGTALIGFAGSPWTIAVYMIEGRGGTDHGHILEWAGNRPDDFQVLMDVLVDATAEYLIRQIENGAPADIYISANPRWMDALAGAGHIDARDEGSRGTVQPVQAHLTRRVVPGRGDDRVPGAVAWNLFDIDAKFADVEPVNTCVNYLNNVEGWNK